MRAWGARPEIALPLASVDAADRISANALSQHTLKAGSCASQRLVCPEHASDGQATRMGLKQSGKRKSPEAFTLGLNFGDGDFLDAPLPGR